MARGMEDDLGFRLEEFARLEVGKQRACLRDRICACHQMLSQLSVHVPTEKGKYLQPISFSLPKSNSSFPKSLRAFRLPGLFPRSIIAANFVARLIKSGKLVKLPLASASRTASISSLGGRRIADNLLNPGLGVRKGDGPGCNELA